MFTFMIISMTMLMMSKNMMIMTLIMMNMNILMMVKNEDDKQDVDDARGEANVFATV